MTSELLKPSQQHFQRLPRKTRAAAHSPRESLSLSCDWSDSMSHDSMLSCDWSREVSLRRILNTRSAPSVSVSRFVCRNNHRNNMTTLFWSLEFSGSSYDRRRSKVTTTTRPVIGQFMFIENSDWSIRGHEPWMLISSRTCDNTLENILQLQYINIRQIYCCLFRRKSLE